MSPRVALVALGLGDRTEPLNWLEQGYRERDGFNIGWIKIAPLLDPLRGNPRYEAFVQKVIGPRESKQ